MKKGKGLLISVIIAGVICAVCIGLYAGSGRKNRENGVAGVSVNLTSSGSEMNTGADSSADPVSADASSKTDSSSQRKASVYSGESDSSRGKNSSKVSFIRYKGYVAIDPGHQAPDVDMSAPEPIAPGSSETKMSATGGTSGRFSGIGEYELNLEVAEKLSEVLKARGYRTILTRYDNETAISNSERAELANESGADFLIRIHANGSENSGASGACALIPGPDNPWCGNVSAESSDLASDVLASYCSATGIANQGITNHNDMTGINWSTIPVMILEMGYMTNQSDDLYMADPSNQDVMASAIADGIEKYYETYPTSYDGMYAVSRDETDVTASGNAGESSESAEYADSEKLNQIAGDINKDYLSSGISAGESWSMTLIDLKENSRAHINGDQRMLAASEMKLFIMAAVYDRVCDPENESRRIYFDEAAYGDLKTLINSMITVSDNDAANSLVRGMGGGDFGAGMAVVNRYCAENGYTGTHMGRAFLDSNAADDNYTTADDCADILAAIYNGTCVNARDSAKMLSYLKAQTRTSKIPAGVAGYGVTTANKTGELAGAGLGTAENDAAIVFAGNPDYILVVFSSGIGNNQAAASVITKISAAVYQKLEN